MKHKEMTKEEIRNTDEQVKKAIVYYVRKYKQQMEKEVDGSTPASIFLKERSHELNGWSVKLDKIIFSFNSIGPELPADIITIEKDSTRLKIINEEKYKIFLKEVKDWKEQVNEGRQLFINHIDDLWW